MSDIRFTTAKERAFYMMVGAIMGGLLVAALLPTVVRAAEEEASVLSTFTPFPDPKRGSLRCGGQRITVIFYFAEQYAAWGEYLSGQMDSSTLKALLDSSVDKDIEDRFRAIRDKFLGECDAAREQETPQA